MEHVYHSGRAFLCVSTQSYTHHLDERVSCFGTSSARCNLSFVMTRCRGCATGLCRWFEKQVTIEALPPDAGSLQNTVQQE